MARPVVVPPGSRVSTARAPSSSASRRISVVFPLPSIPSNVMNGTRGL